MRIPEASFLLIAAILHAAIPVMAHVVPKLDSPLVARPIEAETEIEIDVTLPASELPVPMPERHASVDSTRPTEQERAPEPHPELRPTSRETDTLPSPTSTVSPEAPPAPPGSSQPSQDAFDPLPPDDGRGGITIAPPGLGGRPVWTLPGVLPEGAAPAAAPTVPPAARPTDKNIAGKVLTAEMRSQDKKLGLDLPAAGTVASAIGNAVRGEDTPTEGRATFEVRLGANGQVLGVRVVSSGAGTPASWERAARAAAILLAGRTLTMTSAFAAGATVYVDVSSALTMPDGSAAGVIRPKGAGASFDLSNIGARPSRMVRTGFRVVPAK